MITAASVACGKWYSKGVKNNKVINGGVQAYGIDQMYLRSMDIIQNYKTNNFF